jgi:hypothetical protein
MEFALVSIAAIPLLFGTVAFGITLGRGVQAIQVTRDVGHMYGLGVDFSTAGARNIVNFIAQDYNLNATSGNAVLILSQILKVSASNCTAAGVSPCPNQGQTVFIHRIVLGNPSLRASNFGTPPAADVQPNGIIPPDKYLTQSNMIANGFSSVLTQAPGDIAWVTEGFFRQPDLNFLSPGISSANQGTYVRTIF